MIKKLLQRMCRLGLSILLLLFLHESSMSYEFDKYGGLKSLVTDASGFFEVDTLDGRMWLITPEGHGYFHLGIDRVRAGDLKTAGQIFQDFYGNSDDSLFNDMLDITERLGFSGWGFECEMNTELSDENQDDTRFYIESQKPFTMIIRICYNLLAFQNSGLSEAGYDLYDEVFPDVYSQEWEKKVDYRVELICSRLVNNPYLIGYFIGNELQFELEPRSNWTLRLTSLDPGEPGKIAFQECMEDRYETIESFNDVYGDSIGYLLDTFDDLQEVDYLSLEYDDSAEFLQRIIDRLFTVCREKIDKYDPNHLFLGSRIASSFTSFEALDTVADHVDILSVIQYGMAQKQTWNYLTQRYNKPILHVEFSFLSADTGYDNSPYPEVPTQLDRGIEYKKLVETEARFGNIVGINWFAFYDHGRIWKNYGIIDSITNEEYTELTDYMVETNSQIYDLALNYYREYSGKPVKGDHWE